MQNLEGWNATSKVTGWELGASMEQHYHIEKSPCLKVTPIEKVSDSAALMDRRLNGYKDRKIHCGHTGDRRLQCHSEESVHPHDPQCTVRVTHFWAGAADMLYVRASVSRP